MPARGGWAGPWPCLAATFAHASAATRREAARGLYIKGAPGPPGGGGSPIPHRISVVHASAPCYNMATGGHVAAQLPTRYEYLITPLRYYRVQLSTARQVYCNVPHRGPHATGARPHYGGPRVAGVAASAPGMGLSNGY